MGSGRAGARSARKGVPFANYQKLTNSSGFVILQILFLYFPTGCVAERLVCPPLNLEVAGSIPARGLIIFYFLYFFANSQKLPNSSVYFPVKFCNKLPTS